MILYGDGIHDDTAALQELLDQRGIVTVDKPGVYSLPIGITINNSHDITFEDPNIKAQVTVEQE